jgi:hypothetical protein
MMEHTKEPWSFERNGVYDSSGKCVLGAACGDPIRASSEANARRIAACVNACANLTTECLETYGYAVQGILGSRAAYGEAIRQRDEMARVLSRIAMGQIYDQDIADVASDTLSRLGAPHICGRINSGHVCTMPAGSSCPDCGPSCHSVPEGA